MEMCHGVVVLVKQLLVDEDNCTAADVVPLVKFKEEVTILFSLVDNDEADDEESPAEEEPCQNIWISSQ